MNKRYIITLYCIHGSQPWRIQTCELEASNNTKIKDIIARRGVFAQYVIFEFRKKSFLFDTRCKVRQLRTNLTVAQLLAKITSVKLHE